MNVKEAGELQPPRCRESVGSSRKGGGGEAGKPGAVLATRAL